MKNPICTLLPLLALSTPALADCLKAGDSITLKGTLVRSSFAAELDTARVETGEHTEGYWFVKTSQPIDCVNGADTRRADWNRKFQLLLSGGDYDHYRPMLGRQITLTGKIILASGAQHKTAILIELDKTNAQPENTGTVTYKVILH